MIYFLINPLANNKKGIKNIDKLISSFKSIFNISQLTIEDIRQINDYNNFFSLLNEEDIVIFAGGDGTVSSFANIICNITVRQKIFYFPCGSGNDFYNDVKDDLEIINTLVPFNKFVKSLPIVKVNGITKYFINGIGFGIDGYACEEGDRIRAKSNKKVNYTLIALKGLLGGFHPCDAKVTVDGTSYDFKTVWLAPSMLGSYYGGGMKIAPMQNRLNENKTLSCIIAHDLNILKIIPIFPKIYKGNHIKHKKYISIFQGHNITVEFSKEQALQIDGETISGVKSYSVCYK